MVYFWSSFEVCNSSNFNFGQLNSSDFIYLNSFDFDYLKSFLNGHSKLSVSLGSLIRDGE